VVVERSDAWRVGGERFELWVGTAVLANNLMIIAALKNLRTRRKKAKTYRRRKWQKAAQARNRVGSTTLEPEPISMGPDPFQVLEQRGANVLWQWKAVPRFAAHPCNIFETQAENVADAEARRARRSRIALSRMPCGFVRSHDATSLSTSTGGRYRGSADSRHCGIIGMARSSPDDKRPARRGTSNNPVARS
jgi:hypothetical protein